MKQSSESSGMIFKSVTNMNPSEGDYVSLYHAFTIISEIYLPKRLAERFIFDLLKSGMIEARGKPLESLVPCKSLTVEESISRSAFEPSAWKLCSLPVQQSRHIISPSFWVTALASDSRLSVNAQRVYIHADYNADAVDWDSSSDTILLNRDVREGSIGVYCDVVIRWGDIEDNLAHDAISIPYKHEGISALIHGKGKTGAGRPQSDKWGDWMAEVALAVLERRVSNATTAARLCRDIEDSLNKQGKKSLVQSTTFPIAKAVIARLKSAEKISRDDAKNF